MFRHHFMKDKNFILLFFGNFVSGVGSRIHGFGISLYLLELTGLASVTGTYIGIWSFVLFLFGPIAATFTDRWRNKAKVLVVTDYGRGVLYLLLGLLIHFFTVNSMGNTVILLTIYATMILIAGQTAFFAPAVTALVPQIVEKEELVAASSVMQITRSAQNIIGLLFGAFLFYEFGIVVLMVINAVSFILSAVSEMFIKVHQEQKEEQTEVTKKTVSEVFKGIFTEIKAAVRYIVFEEKAILMLTIIILVSSTLISPWFTVGVPFMIKEYFDFGGIIAPEYVLAASSLAESIGIILLSLVVSAIAKKYKIYELLRTGGTLFVAVSILYLINVLGFDFAKTTVYQFVIILVLLDFIWGCINAVINAPINASIQKYVHPSKVGTISTLIDSLGGILFPLTAFLAGYAIDNVSFYIPLVLMILSMVAITVMAYMSKQLRHLT